MPQRTGWILIAPYVVNIAVIAGVVWLVRKMIAVGSETPRTRITGIAPILTNPPAPEARLALLCPLARRARRSSPCQAAQAGKPSAQAFFVARPRQSAYRSCMLLTLRYAVRSIRSAPLASAVVVLCIGLSIGATTTVFAWTEHLVRRPLPAVAAVDRVVSVATRAQGSRRACRIPDYLDWRDQAHSIPALAAFGFGQFALRASGDVCSRGGRACLGTSGHGQLLRRARCVAGRSGARSRRANRASRRKRRWPSSATGCGGALWRRTWRDRPPHPAQWHRRRHHRRRSGQFRRDVCRPRVRRLGCRSRCSPR